MIATLSGKVAEKIDNTVIVEVGGAGYELAVTAADWGSAAIGEDAKFYVHEHIREDAHDLYGFSNLPSKRFFEQLLSINGVGPKVAMGVLSAASLPQLQQAVASGDAEVFKGVAGVGKKTAERIMVELKGKVDSPDGVLTPASSGDPVYQALLGLGYTAAQAAHAVSQLPADLEGEQARVKAALKQLS